MPKPVLTKADFVRRYQAGEFGNRAPTWDTPESFCRSKTRLGATFHLRCRAAGGPTYYGLDWIDVMSLWRFQDSPKDWYCSAMAPHAEYGTAQGEVQRSVNWIDLTITTGRFPMREALLTDYTTLVQGLRAISLLRHFMDPPSYEWLEYLLDTYPGHVVEFSCFSRPWGTIPGMNTVFWEVRQY